MIALLIVLQRIKLASIWHMDLRKSYRLSIPLLILVKVYLNITVFESTFKNKLNWKKSFYMKKENFFKFLGNISKLCSGSAKVVSRFPFFKNFF